LEEIMSRTLVDIPANMLTQLTELARKLDISRAELMRKILSTELQAIEAVLQEHYQADSMDKAMELHKQLLEEVALKLRIQAHPLDAAFGLWKDHAVDGVEYQRKLRAEWDRDQ
jgi:metal-responsive CopG/Arc/MetJ family transcriptional regulator